MTDITLIYPSRSTLRASYWSAGRAKNVTLTRWRNGDPVGSSHAEMTPDQARILAAELIRAACEAEE